MDQQLKELCIRCDDQSNLEECLGKYTKPRIRKILEIYGVKTASNAKKQEMSDKAEEVIKENVISFFKGEGAGRKADMEALISGGMKLTSIADAEVIKDLLERGFVFLSEGDGCAEAVVPVNVRAIMSLVDEEPPGIILGDVDEYTVREPSGERSPQDEEVIKYAASLANIYGVYPAGQLKEVWDFNHQRGISPKDIMSALEKSGDSDGFYINDAYIVSNMLKNVEDYINVLSSLSRADMYYYPPDEVIDEFSDGPVYSSAPEYFFLRSWAERKTGSIEAAEAFINELFLIAVCDTDHENVIRFVKNRGIAFEDDDDEERFRYLYLCWTYGLRIWACKGYMPAELRDEKIENRNFRPVEGLDPKKIRLTGRNDSCPCGSGRKYKKCCMKYTEN